MTDSSREGACLHEVLLGPPLPDQDVALAHLVQKVVGLGAAHAADQHNVPHACCLGCINLVFLPHPVHLQQQADGGDDDGGVGGTDDGKDGDEDGDGGSSGGIV